MTDPRNEIEFQRCNLALGKPVDAEALIALAEQAMATAAAEVKEIKDRYDELERNDHADRLERALAGLRKAVCNVAGELIKSRVTADARRRLAKSLTDAVDLADETILGDD